jgi:hypothetical protein
MSSDVRRRAGIKRASASITGTAPQTIIVAQSGYSISIVQSVIHERAGNFRLLTVQENSTTYDAIPMGPSGTIIWDYADQEELTPGSGVSAYLDIAGRVDVMIRYVLHDNRTPTNLNPLTYRPRTTRTPNSFGGQ